MKQRHAKESMGFAKCSKCEKPIQPGEPRYKLDNKSIKCVRCFNG